MAAVDHDASRVAAGQRKKRGHHELFAVFGQHTPIERHEQQRHVLRVAAYREHGACDRTVNFFRAVVFRRAPDSMANADWRCDVAARHADESRERRIRDDSG
jgi:hypothetical protein